MTPAFAKALVDFDAEEVARVCDEQNEPPHCLDCNGEYCMEIGDDPTALCDSCAHQNLYGMAVVYLAALDDLAKIRTERDTLKTSLDRVCASVAELHAKWKDKLDG